MLAGLADGRATGLIGAHVLARLRSEGAEAVATTRGRRASTGPQVRSVGLPLAREVGYDLRDGLIVLSILLYLLTGAFWLPIAWIQARLRRLAAEAAAEAARPAAYPRLFRLWSCSASPPSPRSRSSSG